MNDPPELRALVVEADPNMRDLFESLLNGWSIRFIRDPWVMPDPAPADLDLLVIDEDYPWRPDGSTPEWPERLTQRLPTIVLRTTSAPRRVRPTILVLPKPFPVSLFLEFVDSVRQAKAKVAPPADHDPGER